MIPVILSILYFKISPRVEPIALRYSIYFGIDLIGFPGEFAESFSLERYKMYYRAGLDILPLSYSAWFFNKTLCLDEILKKIGYDK